MVVKTAYPMEKNGREGHAAEPAAAGAGIQWLRKQFPERARIVRLRKECFSEWAKNTPSAVAVRNHALIEFSRSMI